MSFARIQKKIGEYCPDYTSGDFTDIKHLDATFPYIRTFANCHLEYMTRVERRKYYREKGNKYYQEKQSAENN